MSITVRELIEAYRSDPISPYRKLRHRTRVNVDGVLRRIAHGQGSTSLDAIKHRTLIEWHKAWSHDGARLPMGHSMMASLRTIVGFGLVFLEDKDCLFLRSVLREMKFSMGSSRDQIITAEQAEAVRAQAHTESCPSMALAQAIQFEGTFRQKDIIGEWVPYEEPGLSEITSARYGKWLRGIRWSEIDENMVLRHVTSKKNKLVEVDLNHAPMVIDEFKTMFCELGEPLTRARLPASGPVILDEESGRPYLTHKFRRRWRDLARAVGIPDEVQNRDTRAGAITEAISFGVSIEDAGKAAAHSTTQMTSRYSRGGPAATARSMKTRAAKRSLKTA